MNIDHTSQIWDRLDIVSNPLLDHLERLRIEKDVPKAFLARQLRLSRHTISRKLSGETELTVGEAYALCQALDTTLIDVLEALDDDLDDVFRVATVP